MYNGYVVVTKCGKHYDSIGLSDLELARIVCYAHGFVVVDAEPMINNSWTIKAYRNSPKGEGSVKITVSGRSLTEACDRLIERVSG